MSKIPRKILITKLNRLGDTVAFLPTLKSIREGWPGSQLTLMTTNIGKELIEDSNIVDELWVANINEIKTFRGFVRWRKIIRRARFHIAIASSDSSSFVPLLFYLSLIPVRVGFTNPRLSLLFNRRIPFSSDITHSELNLKVAKVLGLSFENYHPYPNIVINEKDKTEINKKIPNIPLVVLHIGSNRPSRRWFIDRYAEVTQFLANKYAIKTVCVGGSEEKNMVAALRKIIGDKHIIDLCCDTNVKQLIYVITLAKLFIGHSSGPLHIAYMLGVPTISLWGASSLAIWGPVFDKEKHICIKSEIDCIHCEEVVCPKGTLKCMELITTDMVLSAISKLFGMTNEKKQS